MLLRCSSLWFFNSYFFIFIYIDKNNTHSLDLIDEFCAILRVLTVVLHLQHTSPSVFSIHSTVSLYFRRFFSIFFLAHKFHLSAASRFYECVCTCVYTRKWRKNHNQLVVWRRFYLLPPHQGLPGSSYCLRIKGPQVPPSLSLVLLSVSEGGCENVVVKLAWMEWHDNFLNYTSNYSQRTTARIKISTHLGSVPAKGFPTFSRSPHLTSQPPLSPLLSLPLEPFVSATMCVFSGKEIVEELVAWRDPRVPRIF